MGEKVRVKRDIYCEVTDRIVKALERGVGPWIRPWRGSAIGGHRNAYTGRPYRGVNVLLLNLAAMDKGFAVPLWLTYREAQRLGGHVRRGEQGTSVVFWKILDVPEKDRNGNPVIDPETGEPKTKPVPFLRRYVVFNIEQCAGLSGVVKLAPTSKTQSGGHNEAAEKILALADVRYGGDRAYYNPMLDIVVLPPREAFHGHDHFYATALHELTHWTGHPDRLGRQFGAFGDETYAFEELVAEMGSAFICAHVGVELHGLQHPEYIGSWIKKLRKDKRAIFRAAKLAQQATDWLLEQAGIQGKVKEAA